MLIIFKSLKAAYTVEDEKLLSLVTAYCQETQNHINLSKGRFKLNIRSQNKYNTQQCEQAGGNRLRCLKYQNIETCVSRNIYTKEENNR